MDRNFSVLLSLYFKEDPTYLRQSLESIFNQTLQPSEVVLVKDGELTPALENVINEFVEEQTTLKIVPLISNLGLGRALNEGLKYCTYDLVARMDTDDISRSDRFQRQVNFMMKHPEISVLSGWIEEFEGEISRVKTVRKLPETSEELFQYGKKRCPMNHPCVMYRKKDVLKAGGYRKFPEDYYLWGYMLNAGYKFYNLQEPLLFFRFSSDMFKRRGGLKYALAEFRLQKEFLCIGYVNFNLFLRNITIRFIIRMMPNYLREFVYKRLLRK